MSPPDVLHYNMVPKAKDSKTHSLLWALVASFLITFLSQVLFCFCLSVCVFVFVFVFEKSSLTESAGHKFAASADKPQLTLLPQLPGHLGYRHQPSLSFSHVFC